jgi:hypothetical protein
MQYAALEELLVKAEVSCTHYLVENKIARHCTRPLWHIDSGASHPHPPPAAQNQNLLLVFIIFYKINKTII